MPAFNKAASFSSQVRQISISETDTLKFLLLCCFSIWSILNNRSLLHRRHTPHLKEILLDTFFPLLGSTPFDNHLNPSVLPFKQNQTYSPIHYSNSHCQEVGRACRTSSAGKHQHSQSAYPSTWHNGVL